MRKTFISRSRREVVRCRSVISNEVKTLLKPRFRPWPGPRKKNAELTAFTAMTNSLSRDAVRKQVALEIVQPGAIGRRWCCARSARSAGVWRRERKAVYIRAAPCARSRSNNEATGCRGPTPLVLPHPSYQTSMTDCATLMARVTLLFSPSPTGHFTAASASSCRLRLSSFLETK